jgi:hypothetical protein
MLKACSPLVKPCPHSSWMQFSRTIDFRNSQLDFLARGMASAERAKADGGYVPADKVIAQLRKRLASAQRAARK